jgi:hypothetical protein
MHQEEKDMNLQKNILKKQYNLILFRKKYI